MTNHFKWSLWSIGLIVVLLLAIYGYIQHKIDQNKDRSIISTVLKPNEREKLIINEKNHTITTITRDGTKVQPIGPKSSITVGDDGKITIQTRTFGTELSPFIGVGFDSGITGRAALGLNGFYWRQFELGCGISDSFTNVKDARLFVQGSYNFYGNMAIGITVDNHKTIGALLSVRLF